MFERYKAVGGNAEQMAVRSPYYEYLISLMYKMAELSSICKTGFYSATGTG